jgi:hypothetical protein
MVSSERPLTTSEYYQLGRADARRAGALMMFGTDGTKEEAEYRRGVRDGAALNEVVQQRLADAPPLTEEQKQALRAAIPRGPVTPSYIVEPQYDPSQLGEHDERL